MGPIFFHEELFSSGIDFFISECWESSNSLKGWVLLGIKHPEFCVHLAYVSVVSSTSYLSYLPSPFYFEVLWSCLPSKQLIVPHSREYSYTNIHPACLVSLAVAFLIFWWSLHYTLYPVTVVIIPTSCTWHLKRILVHLIEVCAGLFEETSTVHFRQACQYLKMYGMGGGHTLGNSLTSGPVASFVLSLCSTQSLLIMTGEITHWMTPKVYTNLRVRTLLS